MEEIFKMNKKPKFIPQHVDKCYCQAPCTCCDYILNIEKPRKSSKYQIIKFRDEYGNIIPKSDTKFSGSTSNLTNKQPYCYSFNSSSSSYHHPLHFDYGQYSTIKSSDSKLTEQRQNYEKLRLSVPCSKQLLANTKNFINRQIQINDDIDSNRIEEIKEYRLNNVKDCFSDYTKYTIANQMIKDKIKQEQEHQNCVFNFHLNSRNLLQPTDLEDNGKSIICSKCSKKHENFCTNGIISYDIPYTIILNVQDCSCKNTNQQSQKAKLKKKNLTVPDQSLALIYQEMYR